MIEPVVDSRSHHRALRRIEDLWNARPGSREERELDALATLVDVYERRAFPIRELSPAQAIMARCEQLGWSRKELEPLIGSRARVSEVLTGRRSLTLPMIRSIHQAMKIPAEILISDRPPARAAASRRRARARGPSLARTAQSEKAPPGRRRVRSRDRE